MLLPIVTNVSIEKEWYKNQDDNYSGISLLKDYHNLTDICFVVPQSLKLLNQVGKQGKLAIPNVSLTFKKEDIQSPPLYFSDCVADYVKQLKNSKMLFPAVACCNSLYESGEIRDRCRRRDFNVQASMDIIKELRKLTSWSGRFLFSLRLGWFAEVFRSDTREEFIEFCQKEQPIILIYEGTRAFVDRDFKSRTYMNCKEFGEWLRSSSRPGSWYAGIEGIKGAKRGNLKKCIDWGYDGCLFWLPSDYDSGRYLMDIYTGKI